ncbi:MAG: c-type cytochrome [Taibaiella sp.]|nr:c-type cytochrome [Taibaiella sp.]
MKTGIKKGLLALLLCACMQPAFAQTKPKWVAPAAANNRKNPVAANATVVSQGKTLYTTNCVPCHGAKGKGDGAAAAALNPKPADHSSMAIQSESDGSLFYKMSEGRNPMPAYKAMLTEPQRWALVDYIRTLKKK